MKQIRNSLNCWARTELSSLSLGFLRDIHLISARLYQDLHSDRRKSLSNESNTLSEKILSSNAFFESTKSSSFTMKSITSFLTTLSNAARHEADIIRKARFFHVIDHRLKNITIKDICEQENIKSDREKYWLKQRKRLDNVIYHRQSCNDRSTKISNELMNEMLDSRRNPVWDQSYEIQNRTFSHWCYEANIAKSFQ